MRGLTLEALTCMRKYNCGWKPKIRLKGRTTTMKLERVLNKIMRLSADEQCAPKEPTAVHLVKGNSKSFVVKTMEIKAPNKTNKALKRRRRNDRTLIDINQGLRWGS